jgi:hypothetical protein
MLILPAAATLSVPVTCTINVPLPAPGVLVHEEPENALSYALELKVPFVIVMLPKLRPAVACVQSLLTFTTALAPLITREVIETLLSPVRCTVVFAPTVKVLIDDVR